MKLLPLLPALLILSACATTAGPPEPSPQPVYPIPYKTPTADNVAATLKTIRLRVEADYGLTPTGEAAASTHLVSYPMGVLYAGLLSAGDATADPTYSADVASAFQRISNDLAQTDPTSPSAKTGPLKNLLFPDSLDACGAMGAALVKARRANVGPDLKPVIDRFDDYIAHGQFRLPDGTLARNRPYPNSIWGDDTYMSVPFLAQMGAMTGDRKYFDDASRQMLQISSRLFVPSIGLYTHAWNAQNPDDHPRYYWGRVNGWIIMSLVELLDVLPPDDPHRPALLALLRAHAQGLATVQSGDGMWHQMLDRPDSYLETSCSAMFTFALARAVNRGWLDASAYGPVAQAGWNGITTRIDAQGHITGICIGTNYADDYVYYYSRPAADDIHGYGAVMLAGAEMLRLLHNPLITIDDTDKEPVIYRNK